MARKVIEDTIKDVREQDISTLYAKRAILELIIRDAQKAKNDSWKQKFDDERISAKEQLDIINEELGSRNVLSPVVVNCKPGTFKLKDAKTTRR